MLQAVINETVRESDFNPMPRSPRPRIVARSDDGRRGAPKIQAFATWLGLLPRATQESNLPLTRQPCPDRRRQVAREFRAPAAWSADRRPGEARVRRRRI